MVRIQVKHGDREFLYECQNTCQIDEIAPELIQISNLQYKIDHLLLRLEPLLSPFLKNPKVIPLIRALSEAQSYASKDQVLYNKAISFYVMRDYVQAIERQVMQNYQLLGFEDANQVQQLLADVEVLQAQSTELHWAGKELVRDKRLCDYIGMNEKTKFVLRLQPHNPNPA
ncbi:cilia- and flagella-associated protein 298-B [Ricinus communis]|uniref:Uncharacterized protein n=1 Tax=Ricinus communis TaxID=3988 RepID=B9SLC4_RICCO|nr:cilia- and flagella-associated protein 298-B [Ricinus communis]EEF35599.1 conserved hypothetical protein [Ricinus communis]|eukprot:XP_002526793.1 UPF0769 protein C21orf59 homolog B isoform X2 [Ricinus communis]